MTFESWLDANGLPWRPIPTGPARTPDYAVEVAPGAEIVFEVKQIETNRRWEDDLVHRRKVGAFVRQRINRSKSQIKSSCTVGQPTVLVVFNDYDPLQLSGTEDHDFVFAMYGDYTVRIDRESREITGRFHGDGKSFQANKNTSFSAIARLKESGPRSTVTLKLFENVHAAVPIDYDALPACFEVARFEKVSNEGGCCSPGENTVNR
jgi:hypothetical protein